MNSESSNSSTDSAGQSVEALGELAQAKIRFGMNVVFIFLGLVAYQNDPSIGLSWVWSTFSVCLASALLLYIWARMLRGRLHDPRWRVGQRAASILTDNIAVTWLLLFGGQALAGAYGVYLWITIGYGMRFGLQYLYGNLVVSLAGFIFVTQSSPFWNSNPSLSLGLGTALLVVPIYAGFLIKRLHSAIAEARLAYAAKSDFVARMSHELRTPLHGIISVADLLARTEATIRQKEMFRIISVSSHTLLELINRILDVSKFEEGNSPLQSGPMNLHAVVHESVSILWPQAQLKGLALEFFVDTRIAPDVIGAPLQLQEILINLCGNAVKFTEQGTVRLQVTNVPVSGERVRVHFEISDTGPGIAASDLEKIFNPFYQADTSVTRRHAGSGLGTAIARELVRLMGGDIAVTSEVGKGTSFRFELTFDRQRGLTPSKTNPLLQEVAWVGEVLPGSMERRLAALGVKTISILPKSQAVWLAAPPCLVLADLSSDQKPASELRALLGGVGEEMLIPVCGFGTEALRERAIKLGYNSFITQSDVGSSLDRILALAMEFRREYTEVLARNESRGRIRVLVAEDNLTNQTIARMALSECGFECTVVSDGEQAIRELTEGRHDIALIDMHMPVVDGMEVARLYHFAVTDTARRIPIVMVTADSRPELVADADLAGVTRFLTKPLKPSMMIETINRIMRDRGYEPEEIRLSAARERERAATRKAEISLLDTEVLEELLDFMKGPEREDFFNEFLEDARRYIDALSDACGESSLDSIRDDMHALSGAARTVGAARLAAFARRVEFMSGVDIRRTSDILRGDLSVLLEESALALRAAAGVPAPETPSPEDPRA